MLLIRCSRPAYFPNVSEYIEEEFNSAFRQFKATQKAFILTYFRDAVSPTRKFGQEKNFFRKKKYESNLIDLE